MARERIFNNLHEAFDRAQAREPGVQPRKRSSSLQPAISYIILPAVNNAPHELLPGDVKRTIPDILQVLEPFRSHFLHVAGGF
jgi:hypothetical protein